ncbi:MAG: PaaI family thioesterase [Actinomycetota bacterium]|nr:PaaI family thioesterase [Actinomycetota bacterium]
MTEKVSPGAVPASAVAGTLPDLLGIEFEEIVRGSVTARLELRPDHMAPNGFLHAGTVVALADSACGFGSAASLPDGAVGFTTIELKANFTGTAREGQIRCVATMAHEGRTTQVWDAVVTGASGKTLAMFRCTQLVLYPRERGRARLA